MKYRKNVVALIIKESQVLLVHNKTHGPAFWKFPQGGVELGETEIKAALREIKEELGINNPKLLLKSKLTHKYNWPPEIQKEKGFKGQYQSFWAFELIDRDKDFDFSEGDLDAFKWVSFKDLPSQFELKDMKVNAEKLIVEIERRMKRGVNKYDSHSRTGKEKGNQRS